MYDKNASTRYYQKHKLERLTYSKEWHRAHRKEMTEYMRAYRQAHREDINKHVSKYYRKNKQSCIYLMKQFYKRHKLQHHLCERLRRTVKGDYRSTSVLKLIGCSLEQLKSHLESKFKPGMNWSNYGKWHIDHIKPCCSFDLTKTKEQYKCFNYNNLQPLWAEENLRKGGRY